MTHLLSKKITHSELKQMFESVEVKTYLKQNARKTTSTDDPFLYRWESNDNPYEDLAVAWIFPDEDVVWIDLLIFNDIQYRPDIPEFKSIN